MGVTTESISRMPASGCSSSTDALSAQRFLMRQEDYNALAKLPGNDHCIDCGSSKEVEWASVSFGILFCVRCSYIHKQVVGAHFRCIKAGTPWTRDNLNRMKLGGNEAFRTYLNSKGIDFAKSSMHQRYTCPAAKDYYLELKALVDEAKASVAVALKFPSVQEGEVLELVTARASVGSTSLDDSLELDEAIQPDTTAGHNGSNSSSRGKLYNALAKFSKSGRRLRSDTEETSVTSDVSNSVPNRDETSISEFDTDQEEEEQEDEEIIISRIVTRQSITAMDVSVSECVRMCLEENKEEQSILYKWTANKIAPSVSYMGRSFKVDETTGEVKPQKNKEPKAAAEGETTGESEPPSPAASTTRPKMEQREQSQGSFVNRMGLSWRTDSTDNESTRRLGEEEDYSQRLRHISDSDFRKLKAALRSKGALTGRCVEEMIYTEAASTCALPRPRRASFKSYFTEHPTPRRSRWAPPPHQRHSMIAENTEFRDTSLDLEHEEFVSMNIMPITISFNAPTKEEEEEKEM